MMIGDGWLMGRCSILPLLTITTLSPLRTKHIGGKTSLDTPQQLFLMSSSTSSADDNVDSPLPSSSSQRSSSNHYSHHHHHDHFSPYILPTPHNAYARPKRRGLSLLCSPVCAFAPKSVGSFTLRRLAIDTATGTHDER